MISPFFKNKTVYGHSISESQLHTHFDPEENNRISPSRFDLYLYRYGHKIILTLDDGYLDNITTALPILEKHNICASIFITTGFVSGIHVPMERVAAFFADYFFKNCNTQFKLLSHLNIQKEKFTNIHALYSSLRTALKYLNVTQKHQYLLELNEACGGNWRAFVTDILTPEQVAKLDSHPLITIGAHTISHPDLRYVSDTELYTELTQSKNTLEEWLGRSVTEMAYPYGAQDKRVREAVSEAGYYRAYTTEPKGWRRLIPTSHSLSKPRYDLGEAIKRVLGDDKK